MPKLCGQDVPAVLSGIAGAIRTVANGENDRRKNGGYKKRNPRVVWNFQLSLCLTDNLSSTRPAAHESAVRPSLRQKSEDEMRAGHEPLGGAGARGGGAQNATYGSIGKRKGGDISGVAPQKEISLACPSKILREFIPLPAGYPAPPPHPRPGASPGHDVVAGNSYPDVDAVT